MGNCRSSPAASSSAQQRPASPNTGDRTSTNTVTTKTVTTSTAYPNGSGPSSSSPVSRKPVINKRPKPPPLNAVKQETARPVPTTTTKVTHKKAPTQSSTPSSPKSKNPKIASPKAKKPTIPVAPPKNKNPFSGGDPSRWKLLDEKFAGSAQYASLGHQELVKGKSIPQAIQAFKSNPSQYVAMTYQTSCLDWPVDQQQYTLIHRDGTDGYKPQGTGPQGWMTVLMHQYQRLPSYADNELPVKNRDKYTDNMSYQNTKLHSKTNKPIMPGRGMGVGDTPLLKLIGDVDPSDIKQGSVGNCWMLSGISSLAEFDGAIKKIFRKTPNVEQRPLDGPNMYTVTLWDLKTWKEVDIQVDERLCVMADGSGRLLASQPSDDGELWVCYLEKALAAHCGGWDKITGGQCTHAWALLTGCREQYMISKTAGGKFGSGLYGCHAKLNPNTGKWSDDANSPRDCDGAMWRAPWPEVGGGGGADFDLDQEEMFQRMCAWDQVNFIMAASTDGTSDKHTTGGMVDNHAYSVIECRQNVAGSGMDLIKVRNPWGKGEIEDGMFDDDGPGWNRYPQIKKALNPVVADDGIFWVTRQEFFKIFKTFYLSASNMTEFLED